VLARLQTKACAYGTASVWSKSLTSAASTKS
jgi:hypothetical protein